MNPMFTYEEGSLLLRLLIAHLATDFFFQPTAWVENKRKYRWKSGLLPLHAILAGALSLLFVWNLDQWPLALIIAVTHYIIDGIKLTYDHLQSQKDHSPYELSRLKLRSFITDQLAHIVVIVGAWLIMINGLDKLNFPQITFDYKILVYLTGYLIVLSPAGFLIQMFTNRWIDNLDFNDSLKDVGKWIGMMERVIILTMLLLGQFAAIGFLVTAKSLLRLIDKPDNLTPLNPSKKFSARKHTEYVLAGTFLSFSIALATGMAIRLLTA